MIDIGYFARAHEDGHSARRSKVHVINDDIVLCGYKPHETMKFQWCAGMTTIDYVECNICKQKLNKILDILYPPKVKKIFLELAKKGMI